MALATTTLSAAVVVNQNTIVVASATSFAANRIVRVDDEIMQVTNSYVSGTTIPVIRGVDGSQAAAHISAVTVVHGEAQDFTGDASQTQTLLPFVRATRVVSYGGTATVTLPRSGEDLRIILFGTTIALTVPVPTRDLDGCKMTFTSNAASAHTVTFTGGLGGNTTNSDVATFHATQSQSFSVVAAGGLWTLEGGGVAGAATVGAVGIG